MMKLKDLIMVDLLKPLGTAFRLAGSALVMALGIGLCLVLVIPCVVINIALLSIGACFDPPEDVHPD